ncbi:MAG TPA: hypothetical protein VGA70_11750 [Longimicrobiales bacterium]|jgi:tetratricopeptide (TPR) repeat protein
MSDDKISRPRLVLGVWAVAFMVRAFHNQALLADPLYYNPLGGNVPYLVMAEEIVAGTLLPSGGAFTVNSPLYPYLLAILYKAFGVGSYYAVRLCGSAVDAGTCALVALLTLRHAGIVAAWTAGMALALFGPMIFFATELAPVPYTLFLITLAVLLLDGEGGRARLGLAGVLLGLATAMRPNVLLAGLLALAVPWARRFPAPGRGAVAVGLGLALGILPVTVANLAAGGGFTLLTLSGGHNLYIGHNPAARAQYSLPADLDGDIFQTMKGLAEDVEGRPFRDDEVSGYYSRRAIAWAVRNPAREAALTGRRALLLVNDFEATTYANYQYQIAWSPILRWAPSFAWLLALALPGALLFLDRRRLHVWIPFLVAAASVLLFFYIARLRVVMIPTLGVFAGAAVARTLTLVRRRDWAAVAVAAALAVAALGVSKLPLLQGDTSNDWNKAGGVLRLLERYEEAEAALARAGVANPDNPNTWLNLAALYRDTGRPGDAAAADARARDLLDGQARESAGFRAALEDTGG